MEKELIASMRRNLERHKAEEKKVGFKFTQWQEEKLKSLREYRHENRTIINTYTKGLNKGVTRLLDESYKDGKRGAYNDFIEAKEKGYELDVDISESFFQTNSKKANTMIKVVNNDLKKARNACLRRSNDIYREVIHKASTFVSNGVYTEKKAVDMAIKEFASKGINCIVYKNGAKHTISNYAAMAVRTANQRAQLMAEGEFRKEIGEVLVTVSKHGTACEICQKFEGKIYIDDVYSGGTKKDGNYPLLSEAMKQGMFHPNCRHGLNTYYDLEDIDDVASDTNVGHKEETTEKLKSIYNEIEKKGVIVRTSELDLLDKQLMTENLSKFNELADKYPMVTKYAQDNMLTISAREDDEDIMMTTILRINTNSFINHSNNIYFNSLNYKNYANRVKDDLNDMLSGLVMPASRSQIAVYNMTHEFGHVLENILMTTEIENAGLEITEALLIQKSDEYADEIIKLAKKKNSKFNLEDVISLYAKDNGSKELFAEAFANLECGNPNELGYALKEFLKKKGIYNASKTR